MRIPPTHPLAAMAKPARIEPRDYLAEAEAKAAEIIARGAELLEAQLAKERLEAPSTPNLREHWSKRAKRAKQQRAAGKNMTRDYFAPCPSPRIRITLTRQSPRQLDSDNLAAAMKSYRDGVADFLRIDDGSPLIEWAYAQRKGPSDVILAIGVLP